MNKNDKMVEWFKERQGKVTYSMINRTGSKSYDCSSAVYYAVCEALGLKVEYPKNTATLPEWLLRNGFERIAVNSEWTAERGDIVIWSKRKGVAGAEAHTGIFTDNSHIIHCNYNANGISENTENSLSSLYNWYYEVFRLNDNAPTWQSNTTGWWYEYSDGSYPQSEWEKIDNEWYYFDEKGYAYQNKWLNYENNWYYFDNSCKMCFGKWKYIQETWYYFDDDGITYQNKWLKYKDKWYYFDNNCKMLKDTFFNIGNERFYVNSEGICELSYTKKINNKTYAFDERGALIVNKKINEKGEIE